MQRYLHVHPGDGTEEKVEQEEGGDYARVRVGQERHAAALVGVPERQLMKVHDRVVRDPMELPEEIPVVVEAGLGEAAEDRMAERQPESGGSKTRQETLACQRDGHGSGAG